MDKDRDECPKADGNSLAAPVAEIHRLVVEHYARVYGYAYRLSGSVADAEDLTQQTFLTAQQKRHQVREPDKVGRWLLAIVRSCYLKSRRRRRPVPAISLELDVDQIPEQMAAESSVDPERLQAAIDQLADEFKLVLAMFYFQELSYKEIAAELEIPIGTVMSRLARAKGRLRQILSRRTAWADEGGPSTTFATTHDGLSELRR